MIGVSLRNLSLTPKESSRVLFKCPHKQGLFIHNLILNNVVVPLSDAATFPSVTLGKHLKFPAHVYKISRKAAYGISVLTSKGKLFNSSIAISF